jgi:subtilisin family serine protease
MLTCASAGWRELGRNLCAVFSVFLLAPAFASPSNSAIQWVEGEVLITFKASQDLDTAGKSLERHKLKLHKYFPNLTNFRGRHSGLVRAPGRTTVDLIQELSQDPAVESVEPNYLRWISVHPPNDPLLSQMWALQNPGSSVNGISAVAGADIKFLSAWALARPSTDPAVVAVIDTGVDYTHPDLAANMWVNPGETAGNGVDDDGNGFVDDQYGYNFADDSSNPTDSGVHGSHVAGTIAATGNNQLGVVGVSYQARIMALRASSDGSSFSDSDIVAALDYVTMMKKRGVNIVAVNASFGGGGSNSVERAAIQAAGDAGIIFCAAAGNDAANHDVSRSYPASYRLPNMIVIAATTPADQLANFSDYGGNTVDLGAPGVSILSARPLSVTGYKTTLQQGTNMIPAQPLAYSGTTTGVTALAYDCGLGYSTNFPSEVRGNIALIGRGDITFAEKVSNAMSAGAVAAIVYNNVSGGFGGTLQTLGNWIPCVSIAQADGVALKNLLPAEVSLVNAPDTSFPYQYLDGTSMAAPHVTGAVAFAAMNFPSETVAQRVQRILAGVDRVPGLSGKVRTGGRLNLLRIVDTDGNGLPDWWESEHFGHATGVDPAADSDGDGATNLAEWLAGTDPLNAASALRATGSATSANRFVIQWSSASGKFYRIERSTNLLTGFNSVVRTNIAATPPLNSEVDTTAVPGAARYYRIQVEP